MICPKCEKEAPWVENKEKYGKNYGKSYMCYFCKDCDTYVGCHNNTKTPLGTMADNDTMKWRSKAHAVIDPLWKNYGYTREEVYRRLRYWFGEDIHIGSCNIERCRDVINAIQSIFKPTIY